MNLLLLRPQKILNPFLNKRNEHTKKRFLNRSQNRVFFLGFFLGGGGGRGVTSSPPFTFWSFFNLLLKPSSTLKKILKKVFDAKNWAVNTGREQKGGEDPLGWPLGLFLEPFWL